MNYGLPTEVNVGGVRHEIRSDYRAVLDILTALADCELTNTDKVAVMLKIFYKKMPADIDDAIRQCFDFINCGQPENRRPQPKLMDWEQDFPMIAGAVNQVAGQEVRAAPYMHWWTFMGYYSNIGDCMFAQVVAIRKKLKQHKKLDKEEKEFYINNRELIDIPDKTTTAEDELINMWIGGNNG